MYYIYLFISLIILAIIYYYIFKKDVLSISFISCIIYAISTLAAFISFKVEGSWNYIELHETTIKYLLIAMLCVGIGEFIVRKLIKDNKKEKKEIKLIKVSGVKILIFDIFIIITFILIYCNMVEITNVRGISRVIHAYKVNSAMYNNSSEVQQINFLYTQMYRVCIVIGIIFLYIYVNNLCFNCKLKYNFRFISPIAISIFLSMLIGGRSAIMRFIVAAFLFFIIIFNRKKKIKLFKFIKIGILVLIVVLPLFYMLLGAIGQTTKNNFVDYMTFYLGSPIPGLNQYLLEENFLDIEKQEHFGENTFVGIQQILYKFHIIDYYNIYQSEWIHYGNGLSSNVFTGIKVYIQDFGMGGVIAFQILFGIVYSFLYLKSKNGNYKYLIFYGIIGITLIDQYRSEKIFNTLIRIDTFVYIVSIFLITYFLFNFKIEKK